MKKGKKVYACLALAFSIMLGSVGLATTNANAATVTTKTKTNYFTCRAHSNCMYVKLSARFNSKKCTDVYWNGSYTHWPNGITLGNVKAYTSSARGTYTMYSSIITQWASLAFQSYTDTIYIYK